MHHSPTKASIYVPLPYAVHKTAKQRHCFDFPCSVHPVLRTCQDPDQSHVQNGIISHPALCTSQDRNRGHVQNGIIQDINRHAAVVVEGLPGDDQQVQTAEDVAEAVQLARQVN